MTDSAIIAIAAAISIAFSTIGPALGQGKTAAAMESIASIYADAAENALKCGFDMILIHGDGGSHHLRPADRLYARRQGLRGAQL